MSRSCSSRRSRSLVGWFCCGCWSLGRLCLLRSSAQSSCGVCPPWVGCPPPSQLALPPRFRACCFLSHALLALRSRLRILCSPRPSCRFLALLAIASSNVSPSRMYQCAGPSWLCSWWLPPSPSPSVAAWCWCGSSSSVCSAGGCGGFGLVAGVPPHVV